VVKTLGNLQSPRVLCSSSPAKQPSLKDFFQFSPRKNATEFHCHHQPSQEFMHCTSLPFTPAKNKGNPQSNRGSTSPREAASLTIRTTLLGTAAQDLGVVSCDQKLQTRVSQPLSNMPSKSKLNDNPFIF